jgi:ankyrin repeat protein
MPVDLVIIATFMANQGFNIGGFLATSKEFYNDINLMRIVKDRTYSLSKNTRLMHACWTGDEKRVAFLLSVGANIKASTARSGYTPLLWAGDGGHTEIVRLLIKKGANVNDARKDYGGTTLMQAARFGHLDMVHLLVENGADVNAVCSDNGWTSLILASCNGHLNIVKYLVNNGANPHLKTHRNCTAITWANFKGYHAILNFLNNYNFPHEITP